jgi:hypothetical protein
MNRYTFTGPLQVYDGREIPTSRQVRVDCPYEGGIAVLASSQQGVNTAQLFAAAPDLLASLDPDTLEAIADEIGEDFKHSAGADSLRAIARRQRDAIDKATRSADQQVSNGL